VSLGVAYQAGADLPRILEGAQAVPSVPETFDAVVGVDTHRDTHTAEIAAVTGRVIATETFAVTSAGYEQLLEWIRTHRPGPSVLVAIEGTRSYGLGLTRAVQSAGLTVIEAEQPTRKQRRGKGKSDLIDAHHAVLTALAIDTDRLPIPRADGDREALRLLHNAHRDLTFTKTRQINQLKDVLRGGDDTDHQLACGKITDKLLAGLTRRRVPAGADRLASVRQQEIRRLAIAIRQARIELKALGKQILALVEVLAPGLTDRPGIGPITGAQAILSYSHPGRCRNDAAFAALAGVSVLEASSGQTVRHRLNRGGDRALNHAIHTIAVTRMRNDPRTRAYAERRTAQGKSTREIRRCLKRYISREIYRELNRVMTLPAAT
jgi:transposase